MQAKFDCHLQEYDEGLSLEDYYGHLHAALVSFKSLLADVDRAGRLPSFLFPSRLLHSAAGSGFCHTVCIFEGLL